MKWSYFFIIIIFFFSTQILFAETITPPGSFLSSCPITLTLRSGSVGDQVKCLQTIVGVIADGHFGPKTKAAVVAWQLKHNLVADGVVGLLTRTAMNSTPAAVYPPGCDSTTKYSVTTGKKCDSNEISINPVVPPSPPAVPVLIPGTNLAVGSKMPEYLRDPQKNLEVYIASVKMGLVKRGETPDNISLIEENIRKSVAENPNATQQFFDAQREIYNKKVSGIISKAPALSLLDKVLSFFNKAFSTNKALAASQLPFGGYIGVYPVCTCTGGSIVQLYVSLPSAPPGISNMTMNYVTGTQAFLNYNIPEEGIAVLGFYNPAANEACTAYAGTTCVIIPAGGQILPMVGSSLTP